MYLCNCIGFFFSKLTPFSLGGCWPFMQQILLGYN